MKCNDCDKFYVGEIGRSLETRLKEHQTRANSALYEHCDENGHSISADNTKVLLTEDHTIKRRVKEAIKIKQYQPKLNRDEGLELPAVYTTLLVSRFLAWNNRCDIAVVFDATRKKY